MSAIDFSAKVDKVCDTWDEMQKPMSDLLS